MGCFNSRPLVAAIASGTGGRGVNTKTRTDEFCVVRFDGHRWHAGEYFPTREAVDRAIDAAMEEERRKPGFTCGTTWFISYRGRKDTGFRQIGSRSI